jgi:hypothetical protein
LSRNRLRLIHNRRCRNRLRLIRNHHCHNHPRLPLWPERRLRVRRHKCHHCRSRLLAWP